MQARCNIISHHRKLVVKGVFEAELNELLTDILAEDGYSGVEIRQTPSCTDVIISATRTQSVLGEKGRRIRELTSLINQRFKFDKSVELYVEKVNNRGLCATTQAESLRYKLIGGLAVRRNLCEWGFELTSLAASGATEVCTELKFKSQAVVSPGYQIISKRACYGVLRFIMESGAKGAVVVVSGKLRGQRAKSMKFTDGIMIHSGNPPRVYVDEATRHVLLRQGVLGIKVKIMLNWDPSGKLGPKNPLPDHVSIVEVKEDMLNAATSLIELNL